MLQDSTMCDKAVDTCPIVFDSVLDQYKTQEMCDEVAFEELFMLLDRYDSRNVGQSC